MRSFSGLYYGVSICLVSFASALSVVTLNIYHRGVRGAAVPKLVRTVVLNHLSKMVFMKFETTGSQNRNHQNRGIPLQVSSVELTSLL